MDISKIIDNFHKNESELKRILNYYQTFHQKNNILREILGSNLSFSKKLALLCPDRITSLLNFYSWYHQRNNFLRNRFIEILEKEGKYDYVSNSFLKFFKQIKFVIPDTNIFNLINSYYILKSILVNDKYHARNLMKKEDVVIDIGANIGSFCILASSITKNKIFAFEPSSKNSYCLKKNLSNFKINNVSIIRKALGDTNKKALLHLISHCHADNILSDSEAHWKDNTITEEVEITTLDTFVEENKIKKIDFIKMDCEGYELNVLGGASNVIQKFKPRMVISAVHLKNDVKNIIKLISSLTKDYQYKMIDEGEKFIFFY